MARHASRDCNLQVTGAMFSRMTHMGDETGRTVTILHALTLYCIVRIVFVLLKLLKLSQVMCVCFR